MLNDFLTALSATQPQVLGAASAATEVSMGAGAIGALLLFMGFFLLLLLLLLVLILVAYWKIFVKAGRPGWASLIPFYNNAVLLEIVKKPLWWILLMFVPIVNIFIWFIVLRRLAASFGKGVWFTIGIIFLPFIFYPILAFGSSSYADTFPEAKPLSDAGKWALIAAGSYLFFSCMFALAMSSGTSEPLTVVDCGEEWGGSNYATDGTYVYYNDRQIPGADPSSFQCLGLYALDDYSVFMDGEAIAEADPDTFVAPAYDQISDGFTKDAEHVFYFGELVMGADPSTFKTLGYGYGKDEDTLYFDGEEVIEIQPGLINYDALGLTDAEGYFEDEANIYYVKEEAGSDDEYTYSIFPVEGADRDSFGGSYAEDGSYDAEDKDHFYLEGEIVG